MLRSVSSKVSRSREGNGIYPQKGRDYRAELEDERRTLQRKLREPSDARVVVLDTVHENVMLDINGARTVVTNRWNPARIGSGT